jgi:hypothetical protein
MTGADVVMSSRWTYTLAVSLGQLSGKYLLCLDGHEVGMISLLDTVPRQSLLMRTVIGALNSTERAD